MICICWEGSAGSCSGRACTLRGCPGGAGGSRTRAGCSRDARGRSGAARASLLRTQRALPGSALAMWGHRQAGAPAREAATALTKAVKPGEEKSSSCRGQSCFKFRWWLRFGVKWIVFTQSGTALHLNISSWGVSRMAPAKSAGAHPSFMLLVRRN